MKVKAKAAAIIPPKVLDKALQKLEDVACLLAPYVTALTEEERHYLPKMSNKTVSFVTKVKEYANTNGDFAPNYMDVNGLVKNMDLVKNMMPLNTLAEQLAGNINDTVLLAGSDAYSASLLYYNHVKIAALKGIVNAGPIYNDLKIRFARNTQSKPPGSDDIDE